MGLVPPIELPDGRDIRPGHPMAHERQIRAFPGVRRYPRGYRVTNARRFERRCITDANMPKGRARACRGAKVECYRVRRCSPGCRPAPIGAG